MSALEKLPVDLGVAPCPECWTTVLVEPPRPHLTVTCNGKGTPLPGCPCPFCRKGSA
jgi:hypothetical protein